MVATEISADGYADIADVAIVTGWAYLEVQEADGTPIVRRQIVDGTNTEWVDIIPPVLRAEMDITGSDIDLPALPVTVKKIALFKTAVSTTAMVTQTFDSSFTLNSASDNLTVAMNVQVPIQT